ncbi:large conductance mechanosensitive channel protein [Lachnoanaerobaculum saburreum F0468]|jgi:large conductance mechanosensitive channel protein|uniref:Large-conductance mechanosensitive channel n=2 Tax=Lachnoanaerobaculum saburreum TaxID=467210 RepID=I0R753_9FIRM|nr:large-conductance mechanosensitive channel protein MscL [Lachnoanaerobaculum saburreum]EFU77775.1 large conductance mechanosensitive channel protein [Lachnoanaerobaculum saburreum DSM 3986]EIC95511.1 large conductance mechanosensitive channel protein [Lachnoanaerobaculum saburreum F0468]
MLKDFKEFAFKGNVLDMAIGVIIGTAFGKIVTSLVKDMIMPIISILTGGINFTNLKFIITPKHGDVAENAIAYGTFIQNVVDFLIIAFCIFLFVRLIEKFKKKEEVKIEAPKKADDIVLLEEIRDLLKAKK